MNKKSYWVLWSQTQHLEAFTITIVTLHNKVYTDQSRVCIHNNGKRYKYLVLLQRAMNGSARALLYYLLSFPIQNYRDFTIDLYISIVHVFGCNNWSWFERCNKYWLKCAKQSKHGRILCCSNAWFITRFISLPTSLGVSPFKFFNRFKHRYVCCFDW